MSFARAAGRDYHRQRAYPRLFDLQSYSNWIQYSSGTVGILPLDSQTAQPTSTLSTVQLHGTGPNAARQEGSHPHQVIVHTENEELLVADLGSDSVYRLQKTANGSYELRGHIGFAAGGGPRHLAFYGACAASCLSSRTRLTRTSRRRALHASRVGEQDRSSPLSASSRTSQARRVRTDDVEPSAYSERHARR